MLGHVALLGLCRLDQRLERLLDWHRFWMAVCRHFELPLCPCARRVLAKRVRHRIDRRRVVVVLVGKAFSAPRSRRTVPAIGSGYVCAQRHFFYKRYLGLQHVLIVVIGDGRAVRLCVGIASAFVRRIHVNRYNTCIQCRSRMHTALCATVLFMGSLYWQQISPNQR